MDQRTERSPRRPLRSLPGAGGWRLPRWLALTLPLFVPLLAVGASFGALAQEAGIGLAGAVTMSATTFAGSAQLAAAALLADGASVWAAVGAAVVLNSRYLPMGAAVAPAFEGPRWRRTVQAQMIVDESWALSQRPEGGHDLRLLLATGSALLVAWTGGTLVGALSGRLLEPSVVGLDAVIPTLFLALLLPRARRRREGHIAVVSMLVASGVTPFVPPGLPVLLGAATAVVVVRRR